MIEGKLYLPKPRYNAEWVKLYDGENILCSTIVNPKISDWIVLIPGGLNGSNTSLYCREIATLQSRYNIIVINHRGWGEGYDSKGVLVKSNYTVKNITLHDDTDTIECGLDYLIEKYSVSSILMVGVSMGSFMLTQYLVSKHFKSMKDYIFGAVCLTHYFNLHNHTKSVMNSRWLHRYALSGCESVYKKMKDDIGLEEISFNNLEEAIKKIILPHKGITLEDYYNTDTLNCFYKINVPTLYVNSLDDPLSTKTIISKYEKHLEVNPKITFAKTFSGGHLGWNIGFLISTITTFEQQHIHQWKKNKRKVLTLHSWKFKMPF